MSFGNTALYEAVVSNQNRFFFLFFFFFIEEIRYVHDVFTLGNALWLCAVRWERYQVRCRSTKASKAGGLIDPFGFFLKQRDLPTVVETSYSTAGKAASPSSPILPALAARKETNIFSECYSALRGIQREGPGSAVLPPFGCSG